MIGEHDRVEETDFNRQNEMIGRIAHSEVYQDLIKQKKRFIARVIIFFVSFYFALPLGIILFPNIMSIVVFHHLTIAWIFAFLQFVMIWGLGGLYFFRAKQFDRLAEKLAPWGRRV